MLAEVGKTYCVIDLESRVGQIFTINELPEWHDAFPVKDITGLTVNERDIYDPITDTFSAP